MADLNNFRQPHIFLKLVEIVLLVVAIATFFSGTAGWPFYASSIILGCFINAIILLGLYLLGYTQIQQTPLELALYAYYGLGLFVSSILLMSTWYSNLVASGVFCLLLTAVYGADGFFAFTRLSARPISFPPGVQPPTPADAATANANPPSTLNPSNLPPPHISQSTGIYPPPYQPRADVVDTGVTTMAPSSLYVTDPAYPPAFDYPPAAIDDTPSYPPEVAYGPRP